MAQEVINGVFVIDTDAGNGNKVVYATAEQDNTGRKSRSKQFLLQAAGCADITLEVEQEGKPSFIQGPITIQIPKEGGYYEWVAKTNCVDIGFEVPELIQEGGYYSRYYQYSLSNGTTEGEFTNVENTKAVPGDPGATREYLIRITNKNGGSLIPANPSTSEKNWGNLYVDSPTNGESIPKIQIIQAGGDPTLAVSPAEITLPWNAGTESSTDTFTVTSNTNWTVS